MRRGCRARPKIASTGSLHARKIDGFCSAKPNYPKQNRRFRARPCNFVLIWWLYIPKLEPISRKNAEPRRLTPNVCGRVKRPLAPPEKSFDLFFEFLSPIFLFSCKGCFLVVATTASSRGVVASPRRHNRHRRYLP